MEHPLERAIRLSGLGSAAALAKKLGVSRPAVQQWKLEGRRIPAKHCPIIEKLTGGAVRCEELKDRVDWGTLRHSSFTEKLGLLASTSTNKK